MSPSTNVFENWRLPGGIHKLIPKIVMVKALQIA